MINSPSQKLKDFSSQKYPKFKTKDGEQITFSLETNFILDEEPRTFTFHKITSFVNNKESGFILLSILSKADYNIKYPTPLNQIQEYYYNLGLVHNTILKCPELEKDREESLNIEHYRLDSLEGKQTLVYKLKTVGIPSIFSRVASLLQIEKLYVSYILNLSETELDQIIDKKTIELIEKYKNKINSYFNFHVDKPLVSNIYVFEKGNTKKDGTINDKDYRNCGIGKSLYQMATLWLAENNLELYRSGVQSDCAKKITNESLKIEHLIYNKEVKHEYPDSSIIRYVLSAL